MSFVTNVDEHLVYEEDDMTASEAHAALMILLHVGLGLVFGSDALVLSDTFIRHGGRMAAPDVYVIPGAKPGNRKVYDADVEPAPTVTIEILSDANRTTEGKAQLDRKRELIASLGVYEHIELDLPSGTIAVFTVVGRALEHLRLSDPHAYVSPGLRGVKFSSETDQLRVFFPDGRVMSDPAAMLVAARQEAEIARAQTNDARARADRLTEKLRALGVEPD